MKKILLIIMAVALMFAATACGGAPSATSAAEETMSAGSTETAAAETTTAAATTAGAGNTWSVFVYMCGSDLESGGENPDAGGAATGNLQEMLSAGISDGVNVVVETGGAKSWQNEVVDASKLQRYVMSGENMTLVDSQPSASMGDPSTLSDFLKWGVANYPADKYMVVFWNHGAGAVGGAAFDELYDSDSLELNELKTGIADSGQSFELIGFDTCLMATLENAAALAPYGRYLVASEETEPGGGWDYAAWLGALSEDPSQDGLAMGKTICDSYYAKCQKSGEDKMATLSVTDLSAVDGLSAAFDSTAAEMRGTTSDITTMSAIESSAKRAESYGGNTDSEGYTNMVDLGDFVKKSSSVLTETSDALESALSAAVKYEVKGENRKSANGISVFYPLGATAETMDSYAKVATSGNYLTYLSSLLDGWDAPSTAAEPSTEQTVSPDDYHVSFSTKVTDDSHYELDITSAPEAVESVMFNLYYFDEENNAYLCLGTDNNVNGDFDKGVFTDNFQAQWFTIDGNFCAPTVIGEEEGYTLFSIPVLLNGAETNIRARYVFTDDDGNGSFEVLGAYDGIDSNGMSAKGMKQLKKGDTLEFIFSSIDTNTGETQRYTMGKETVGADGVTFAESDLVDGTYIYQYQISDVFGRTGYSDTVNMKYADNTIEIGDITPIEGSGSLS